MAAVWAAGPLPMMHSCVVSCWTGMVAAGLVLNACEEAGTAAAAPQAAVIKRVRPRLMQGLPGVRACAGELEAVLGGLSLYCMSSSSPLSAISVSAHPQPAPDK